MASLHFLYHITPIKNTYRHSQTIFPDNKFTYICPINYGTMEQGNRRYTYHRTEHLKLRKAIAAVFEQNRVLRAGGIKLIFAVEAAEAYSHQVAFVAPKKIHHLAVDRNRNKRLLREAFRLNRHILTDALCNKPLKISFLFVAQNGDPVTFAETESNVRQLLARLVEKVARESADS